VKFYLLTVCQNLCNPLGMAVELLLINDGKKKTRGRKMSKRRRDKYGRFLKTGKKHKKRRNDPEPRRKAHSPRRNEPEPKKKHAKRRNPVTESVFAFLNPRRRRNPSTLGVALSAVAGLGVGYATDKLLAAMEKKATDAGVVFAPPIPPLAIKALAGLAVAGISFAMTRSPVSALAAVGGTAGQAGIKAYMEREQAPALPPPAAAPAAPAAPPPTRRQQQAAGIVGGVQQAAGAAGTIAQPFLDIGQVERQFAMIEHSGTLELIEGQNISALPETRFGDLVEPQDVYVTEELEQGDELTEDEWDLIEAM
jgi:hypothetical protein